jgi:signal transduction histidine kinase
MAADLPHIVGDRTQLQQVIVNLSVNAMQAMAKSVDRNILVRTMLSDPETVCCAIEDSGPGVDPAALPRLFESFFTTREAGMGMGLPISRSIIEAHGGKIRAENNSNLGGARFTFHLPAMNARKSRKKINEAVRNNGNGRPIRRPLALPVHLRCFYPPHQIVSEAQDRPFEGALIH